MNRAAKYLGIICVGAGALTTLPAAAQNFGASKDKVLLQRKLPALVHLPGNSIKVTVTSAEAGEDGALPYDVQALLETELLKDDPDLREDDKPNAIINCQITEYSHPEPTTSSKLSPGVSLAKPTLSNVGKSATQEGNFTRITGKLNISFQAKEPNGKALISDNISSTYDQEFDSSGTSTVHGMFSSVKGSIKSMKGAKSEEVNPPTPAEVRSRLILDAVQQIAEHLVNTNETLEVFLAKQNGALDEGDKDAQAGLWERALETFETAQPDPKPDADAYRLYDIGVAYEALAYQAEDEKATMKYLDQAAINYGKAIDAKPDEKYFLEPQKRIETAIAHYRELDQEAEAARKARETQLAAANAPPGATSARGLTNAQVITMVKSGIDDSTIIQAIHGADAVNFDLTAEGEHTLTSNGVSARILTVMKSQATKRTAAEKAVHKGLTNTQVITMVKSGMDDDAVVQAIHGADAVDFDLSPDGQKQLTSSGVSARVLGAMKTRALRRPTASTRPVAEK
jgi:tetratricopeptide (TPR) repeat protein